MTPGDLRALVVARLGTIAGLTVYDSLSGPMPLVRLPAVNVWEDPARLTAFGSPQDLWSRETAIQVEVAFSANTDAELAAGQDTFEDAVLGSLLRDTDVATAYREWTGIEVKKGRTMHQERRIGVVAITMRGIMDYQIADPDGIVDLHEIRARYGVDGTVQDGDPEDQITIGD